jgi:hypothetical protein
MNNSARSMIAYSLSVGPLGRPMPEPWGYWPKPGVSSCSGVMAATLSRQRSISTQNRSSATAAEGLKSTSSAGGRRRSPKVHSQRPAKSECRCPSLQAIVVTGVGSGSPTASSSSHSPGPNFKVRCALICLGPMGRLSPSVLTRLKLPHSIGIWGSINHVQQAPPSASQ